MTTDTLPGAVRRELDRHDAFVATESGYDLTTTPLAVAVSADEADGERDGEFHVTVTMPTLSAVVEGDDVAEVVEDGWYETLELRLEDTFDVAHTDTHDPPSVERGDPPGVVTVDLTYTAWSAREGVEDAKTLAEFVEGTYVQGVIPGYDYGDPVASLVSQARQAGDAGTDSAGADGGTPL